MPAYNPGDYVWQEIYLMHDQIGQIIQAVMLYIQEISTTLTVAWLGCLAIPILFWAWDHRPVRVNQAAIRMIPRTLLIVLALTLLPGAGNPDKTSEARLSHSRTQLEGLNTTGSGHSVAIRVITLKEGVDPSRFEQFVADEFTPAFERYIPGMRAFILKGNRGDRKGGYAFVLSFDSENTRDFYFPREDVGEAGVQRTALALWEPGRAMIYDRLMTYVDGISETENYTDYMHLGGVSQPVIEAGNMLAVREIALKEKVDPAAFERFAVEQLTATFNRHVPGVRAFIMKGDRGDRKNEYVFLLNFDSINTRDFFFPTEESTEFNMAAEALALWRSGQIVLLDHLLGYVEELGGGAAEVPTGGFTDYRVLG
jgi:hypothetical protein